MTKKLIAWAMVMMVCGAAVFAQSESDFVVGLDKAGTGVVIEGYTGSATKIIVPATIQGMPVVSIGRRAFMYNSNITSVKISEGIRDIEDEAFASLPITTLILPNTLEAIGYRAFGSTGITTLTIPPNVTYIGRDAFFGCAFAKVSIPDSVTVIERRAFMNTPLTEVRLPQNLKEIGFSAFEGTKLTSITIPDSLKVITSAFSGTPLKKLVLPKNVQVIEMGAFAGCSELTEIVFPEGVEKIKIAADAFRGCKKLNLVTQAKLRQFEPNIHF